MRLGKKRATDTQRSDLVTIVLYGHVALVVYGVSSPWPGIWSCTVVVLVLYDVVAIVLYVASNFFVLLHCAKKNWGREKKSF